MSSGISDNDYMPYHLVFGRLGELVGRWGIDGFTWARMPLNRRPTHFFGGLTSNGGLSLFGQMKGETGCL